jgi:hypothetical protein
MGKKKSHTSKKKQTRTGKKTFVKKLGVSEGKPEAMMTDNTTKMNGNKNARRSRGNIMKDSKAMAAQKKSPSGTNEETKDFDRQQKSMVERERHVDWKRNGNKNISKNTSASSMLSTPALQLMQPATFCATDAQKSTSQLVQETLNQVSVLSGIGATTATSSDMNMGQGRQQSSLAMAVAASQPLAGTDTERWTAEADSVDVAQRKNPWAVLDNGDDDDIADNARQQQIPQPSPFQFAPPTFSFGNNDNNNLSTACEIDPDL